jgi:hypothetical protein
VRDKLIKFLGGFTSKDYSFLETQFEMSRNQVIQLNAQNDFLKESIQSADAHVRYLEEVIFREHGLIGLNEGRALPQEDLRPINTKPASIYQTMRAMQRDDRQRVKVSKQESPIPEGLGA